MVPKTPYKARATLTSKGQITLPVELRRSWNLKPGDQLDFALEGNNRVILRKLVRHSFFDDDEGPNGR
jgi:AbrB family looped-hinge helix DNA binding protein